MFVCSFHFSKKTALLSISCVLLLLFAVIAAAITPVSPSATVSAAAQTAEDRVSFLKNRGLEVESEPLEVREIRIPDQADAVMLTYNELLKTAGWDLEPFMGKRVKLYTYRLLNDADSGAKVHLYVYKQTVIGGHISTIEGERPLSR